MVGRAVETDDSSRAERKRQIHIEAKISQNLRLFLDATTAVETSVVPPFPFSESDARAMNESRSLEDLEIMVMLSLAGVSKRMEGPIERPDTHS